MSDWIRLTCDRCGSVNNVFEPGIPSGPAARDVIRFCARCRRERQSQLDNSPSVAKLATREQ